MCSFSDNNPDVEISNETYAQQSNRYAQGSLSIIMCLVMLVDAVVQVYKYRESLM